MMYGIYNHGAKKPFTLIDAEDKDAVERAVTLAVQHGGEVVDEDTGEVLWMSIDPRDGFHCDWQKTAVTARGSDEWRFIYKASVHSRRIRANVAASRAARAARQAAKQHPNVGAMVAALYRMNDGIGMDLALDGSGELGAQIHEWHEREWERQVGMSYDALRRLVAVRTSERWSYFNT